MCIKRTSGSQLASSASVAYKKVPACVFTSSCYRYRGPELAPAPAELTPERRWRHTTTSTTTGCAH